MKKYAIQTEKTQREAVRQKYDELVLFQQLLLDFPDEMNGRFHGNAKAIAYGIQPWIDALEKVMNQ